MKAPVSVGALRKLMKELRAAGKDRKPVALGGAGEIARTLERELTRGGDPSAVRLGAPRGAAVYVHIATGDDAGALRAARRGRVPIVAVAFDDRPLPYVLATDIVRVGSGERLPLDRIAAAIAARLGEAGAPLAGALPVLRGAVCDRIVASFARKNGILGAAVFVPGADLPVLALNQVRMLLLLDQAYGLELDPRERLPEVLAVVGAGLGLRAVARELLDFVPVAGWAVKGGIAYAGTRALGEAAIRRLQLVH
ncbi:MAG TPA: hypothetical protein VMU74_00945 [Gaiellaceae bacterium]|nr:hypothetical protein [Gaiellaceae bacterium]